MYPARRSMTPEASLLPHTKFFPVHELPSGTISSFGKLSRRLIDSKSISSSSQSSRQPRMPSGKIIIIAFGLRWWCRESLLARAFGLSFVSTQNAQGVGEFTLLPTTTYLALNKHIKPQNEVIAWPPGCLACWLGNKRCAPIEFNERWLAFDEESAIRISG